MGKFEVTTLEKLRDIQNAIDGTLNKKSDFRVETIGGEGSTYTFDRENYLQLGLEVVQNDLQEVIEEIEEYLAQKSKLARLK